MLLLKLQLNWLHKLKLFNIINKRKQLQQQELNDNPKVESSPQTSLDPLIDLPFVPSSLNYSLNNSNLASIKRLIKLSKPDSTIDDGSNNWTF